MVSISQLIGMPGPIGPSPVAKAVPLDGGSALHGRPREQVADKCRLRARN